MRSRSKTHVRRVASSSAPDTTLPLLRSFVGFWDASRYSGSGNLLNEGTGGSALDLVPGASAAAPTFSAGTFVFDGSDDFMSVADNAQLDFTAGQAFTVGVIIKHVSAPATFAPWMQKKSGTPGWVFSANLTNVAPRIVCQDAGALLGIKTHATALSTGVKYCFAGIRRTSNATVEVYEGSVASGTAVDASGDLSNSDAFRLGGGDGGANFSNMTLYAAFVHRGELTPTQIITIRDYYGAS